MNHSPSTIAQINQLLQGLREGDRMRVLKFAQALQLQRSGKREKRRSSFQRRDRGDEPH